MMLSTFSRPIVWQSSMEANKCHNYLKFNSHWILSFEIFYLEKHLSEFICSEFTPLKLFYFGNHVSEFICFEFTSQNLNFDEYFSMLTNSDKKKNQLTEFQIKKIQVDQIWLLKFRSQISS